MNNELKKWISDYESGNEVESVEMGGLGDGYECAIQSCAVETIKNLLDKEVPKDNEIFRNTVEVATNEAVEKLNDIHGFSGAQVGAAKNIASVFWRKTPVGGIEKMKESDHERIIKIRKQDEFSCEIVK